MTRGQRLARATGLAALGGTLVGSPASRRMGWLEAEVIWKILSLGIGWWAVPVWWLVGAVLFYFDTRRAPLESDEKYPRGHGN